MTEKLGTILVSLIIGCALNPLVCWLWAKASDWWAAVRPAAWRYRTICEGCGNAPPRVQEVKFRERMPQARRLTRFPIPDRALTLPSKETT